jgi:putative membrane protein insertion efficiency factor
MYVTFMNIMLRNISRRLFKLPVYAYQYLVSPFLPPSCRFHPTCSHYALQAIDRHGVMKGTILTLKRLARCHPWHRGDYQDPVP